MAEALVDVIVNAELHMDKTLQPFKLLADSINYWAVFVEFVGHLRFANRFEIGSTWGGESGKDGGLVCFVCRSEKIGGAATLVFFTASTGKSDAVAVKPAAPGNGTDIVMPPVGRIFSAPIAASDRPLNALAGPAHPCADCVPGGNPKALATPTNLPALTMRPSQPADTIGLYAGGGYRDCGVFRPTGQCRMRSGFDKTTLLCHVCRCIIVDAVDPTKHAELDKSYPEVQL